jgi:uncharacterized RDD family membrane protein YckC
VSTLGQPTTPKWREEVNRRLAEHKNRKAVPTEPSAPAQTGTPGSSRAAKAAARVAARYANAPSYSEMQAEEARIAVRAAEIATQVALEAQSVAESALAELHAASEDRLPGELLAFPAETAIPAPTPQPAPQPNPDANPEWNWTGDQLAPEPFAEQIAEPLAKASAPEPVALAAPASVPQPAPELPAGPVTSAKDSSGNLLHIRWEPDMPLREAEPAEEPFELATEDWFTPADSAQHQQEPAEIEALPIHANVIHFPRELVATRRMRPRLAEGAEAQVQPGTQLSIFEVDPSSIQIGAIETETPAPSFEPNLPEQPVAASPVQQAVAANSVSHPVSWTTAEWHGMKLGAQAEPAHARFAAPRNTLALAPLSRRLLAGIVDFSLVAAIAAFVWITLALGAAQPLQPRAAELLGAGAFAVAGMIYHAFFCLLSLRTPGMRYAGLSLCTLDDTIPSARQMRRRFGAMILSTLPLGLGMVWSIFDEDRLSWHDRYSQTYLRHT